ncbi:winged helix-turn-helix transcriptional regulator [Humidisolicoccus flavus]|uniref:winged helix-turn-helix transcriptional regulator n=1 Tax=Humidisolicoccus flavus TaxID=3111414 RepID=UPI00324C2E29
MAGDVAFDPNPYQEGCPSRRILDQIGGKWTVLIVGALHAGPARFSTIMRRIEGISQKMLTQTLRALERDGLVSRTTYPEVPIRVEYELTTAGKTLLGPLQALQDWSIEHFGAVLDARKSYDAKVAAPVE